MKFGWNGSAPLIFSPILRGKKQKKVRLPIIIYILDTIDHLDEINYRFKFNPPSIRELGNVFYDKYMAFF
jgi:hypothetical protein